MRAVLLGTITMGLVLIGAIAGGGWFIVLASAAVLLNVASLVLPLDLRPARARRPRAPTPLPWMLVALSHLPETRKPGDAAEPSSR